MSKVYKYLLLSILGVLCGVSMSAQSESAHNSYSPYSVYGIGDLYTQGSAYNKSMGGVGIAMRNNQYINYLNPAAVTARDTLSFMADFNLSVQNKMFTQNGKKIRKQHLQHQRYSLYGAYLQQVGIHYGPYTIQRCGF